MSYNIFYEQYASLLESDNYDVVKSALQDIFELLVVGKTLLRSKIVIFTQIVNKHVNSKSQKVRKWAYHCACFYQNESVCESIKIQLQTESATENVIWALTALSVRYDNVFKLKQCVGKRHEEFIETISKNYLTDALVLFGGVVQINPHTILSTNNSADLAALTKIYAYQGLVRDKYPMVTENIIREMGKHDDPYVREYAYWSQLLGGSRGIFLNEPDDSDVGVRKFQIALQIQNGNIDFVVSALKPLASCPQKIPLDIKSGVLRGLNKTSYKIDYVSYINSWFGRETDDSIVFKLIDYIIENCYKNKNDGTYFYIIKDSLNDEVLINHIVSKIESHKEYGLEIIYGNECYNLDFKEKENSIVQNVTVKGSGNTVAVSDNHSTAVATNSVEEVNELTSLINEIKKQSENGLSKEDQNTVNEGLSFIEAESKNDKPRKTIIKGILDGFKAIKGTAEFGAAIVALAQFLGL